MRSAGHGLLKALCRSTAWVETWRKAIAIGADAAREIVPDYDDRQTARERFWSKALAVSRATNMRPADFNRLTWPDEVTVMREAARMATEPSPGEWSRPMTKGLMADQLGLSVDQLNRIHGEHLKAESRVMTRIDLGKLNPGDRKAIEEAPSRRGGRAPCWQRR